MTLSEQDLQAVLLAVLMGEVDPTEALPTDTITGDDDGADEADGGSEVWIDSAATFADEGVMRLNKGLVVRLSDGSEFQLSVIRSR
jgi:hypothetical protein